MNKPVLIIEMPKLNNEEVVSMHDFLHALINTFEGHYFYQLRQRYQQLSLDDNRDIKVDIDDLF